VKGKSVRKSKQIKPVDRWSVTYRSAGMGTLHAYSAIGVTTVAMAVRCGTPEGSWLAIDHDADAGRKASRYRFSD